jgi:hypothetical protein
MNSQRLRSARRVASVIGSPRGYGATALAAARLGHLVGDVQGSDWKNRIGLELYTVRDRMAADFESALAQVAAIGCREIELANGYNDMSPAAFQAMLDRLGLAMPSTHSPATGIGAGLERQLEGFQIMGIKYTEISAPRGGDAAGPSRSEGGRPPGPLPPGAYFNAGTGAVHNAFREAEAFGPYQPPASLTWLCLDRLRPADVRCRRLHAQHLTRARRVAHARRSAPLGRHHETCLAVRAPKHAGETARSRSTVCSTSPPARTRTQRLFGTSAYQTAPSLSRQMPSGTPPRRSAHSLRFDRLPSGATSNAVSFFAV